MSHDRYFINQTATRILDLVNRTFVNYIGNYDYYLEKKDELTAAYAGDPDADAAAAKETVSEAKLGRQEQKKPRQRNAKRQNELKRQRSASRCWKSGTARSTPLMMQEEIFTNSVNARNWPLKRPGSPGNGGTLTRNGKNLRNKAEYGLLKQ